VLATNTSSLSVTALAAGCSARALCRLHFFNPCAADEGGGSRAGLHRPGGVRAADALCAPWATRRCARRTRRLHRQPRGPGYGTEALRIVEEGVADFAIDRILRDQAGFKLGPSS
jgi:3-hydroxybutyryl-CoA dehydrogenase